MRREHLGELLARELIGLAEVAEILGVVKRQAIRFARRPSFPPPVAHVRATRIWLRSEVAAWGREHGRVAERNDELGLAR